MFNYDRSLFEYMQLPAGVDRQTCIETILFKNAELEVIYNSPKIMKEAIRVWSVSRQRAWEKLYATLNFDYNPIWNKDGTIRETEDTTGSLNHEGEASGTDEREVSGYNATGYVPAEKNSSDTSNTYEDNSAGHRSYTRIEQGNIGVTTTQQMIKEEREISDFSIYDYISDDFMQRFTVMIW